MLFNSVEFMVFLPLIFIIYFMCPKKGRKVVVLIASYIFYMAWDTKYALIIGGITIISYFVAIGIDRLQNKQRKDVLLIIGLIVCFGVLTYFKYWNFLINSVNWLISIFSQTHSIKTIDIILPIGISFYTFQAVGYVIDVYRGDVQAEYNIVNFALFVAFFPQIVAGPIEKAKDLLGQIRDMDKICLWNYERITSGTILMIYGFFLKMVIADRAAILVDYVFGNYMILRTTELVIGAICFTIQIYCDFYGYSLIAMGIARIMGIQLMQNFNSPYQATSIKEFWTRWHISLSTWFRDYVYIPLGGNRCSGFRHKINLMIIFLLSGLWHGANWKFVAWGGYHAILRIIEELIAPFKESISKYVRTDCFSWRLLLTAISFSLEVIGWIFFRSNNIYDAFAYLQRMFTKFNIWKLINVDIFGLGLDITEINILIVGIMILTLVDNMSYKKHTTIDKYLNSQNLWFKWAFIIGIFLCTYVFGIYGAEYDANQFIYFQF